MSTATIPRAVLSEHFEERLQGHRLLGAVFLTYRFDPEFFEQDVLPIFLDIPVSHAPGIRLVQLEDALREVPFGITVYYDSNGLTSDARAAKLDVRRVAVCHRRGVFHPKNVLALVERVEPDEDGHHPRTLIVACMSANLTRSGWWENVEVCHCEEIEEGDSTRLKDDLRRFLLGLEHRVGDKAPDGHRTLREIRAFLSKTKQRATRTSQTRLMAHFYDGSQPLLDFFEEAAGKRLRGMNLEIVSPYFDSAPNQLPLQALCSRLKPREVRVSLPRGDTGEASCTPAVLEHVRALEDCPKSGWGTLPGDLVKSGKGEHARQRPVHAKVYRFFNRNERQEVLFIGSVNLTSAAHRGTANLETGFLVEVEGDSRANWWLAEDQRQSIKCKPPAADEESSQLAGTPLALRYSWSTAEASAYWDAKEPSAPLRVTCQGVALFELPPLVPGSWHPLSSDNATAIGSRLLSTSLFTVEPHGGAPGVLLVQEEGMHSRPSLIRDLTAAEILKYWSLLTPAQRAEFLSVRAAELAASEEGAALLAQVERLEERVTFFDRFGGIFVAFATLERNIKDALTDEKLSHASCRLFGEKHDSLPNLLRIVAKEAEQRTGEITEQYVTYLCAKQLERHLARTYPDFFNNHQAESARLRAQLAVGDTLREALGATSSDMPEFLSWFDAWFLKRATPLEAEPA